MNQFLITPTSPQSLRGGFSSVNVFKKIFQDVIYILYIFFGLYMAKKVLYMSLLQYYRNILFIPSECGNGVLARQGI